MNRHLRLLAIACFTALLAFGTRADAQVIDWTAAGSADTYSNIFNWAGFNIPDTSVESPRFNLPGSFDITFGPSPIEVADAIFLQGQVSLTSQVVGETKQFQVVDDFLVTGPASVAIGTFADGGTPLNVPVEVSVGDELLIEDGGSVSILADAVSPSKITTSDLRLADTGSGSADLLVVGPGASFEQTGVGIINLGQDGPAQLRLSNGASASFDAVLQLASFPDASASATVNVLSGSDVQLNSLQIATGGSEMTAFGLFQLADDATTTIGNSAIVGATSGPTGTLISSGSSQLDIGSTTTVNATGTLLANSGVINASGQTTVNEGGTVRIFNDGVINAMGGLDASAGGIIDVQEGLLAVTGGPLRGNDATDFVLLGSSTVSTARIQVGAGSSFNRTSGDTVIGRTGNASLEYTDGAAGELRRPEIGVGVSSNGQLIADGAGTSVDISSGVAVGLGGAGQLTVTNGAVMRVDQMLAGSAGSTASAEIMVSGAGSTIAPTQPGAAGPPFATIRCWLVPAPTLGGWCHQTISPQAIVDDGGH